MIILAIDPGESLGWAVGSTKYGLQACGLCHPDKGERPPRLLSRPEGYDLLVIEKPILTPVGPGSVYHRGNSLITCWGRGCRAVEAVPHVRYLEVQPSTWKGQVPKDVHNRRVLAELSGTERALVPGNHNVIDAVGLLKWALRRYRA